jgi:hypothetical protein
MMSRLMMIAEKLIVTRRLRGGVAKDRGCPVVGDGEVTLRGITAYSAL